MKIASAALPALPTLAALTALALAWPAAWASPEETMTKAGCMACHSKDRKLVGPSFKDIAAKYKGQDAADKLFDKVRKGGSGVFGPVPMAPNGADKIDDAKLKEAIALILKT